MLHQSDSAVPAKQSSRKLNLRDADSNIAAMIQGHMKALKDRNFGIRKTLHRTYQMAERQMNEVSVDVRSGFYQEAYDALLAAWKLVHSGATVH